MIPVFAPKFSLAGVIAGLFSAGEQGVWYDPSDFSTMFQDAAGTTPVTAVGQPVGRILDKSGRGNHATQTTTTSRPILQQDASGRYYLLFDGVDDFLVTPSINFTGTDKMTVFAGVRKLSDAASAMLLELSTNAFTLGNAFFITSPELPSFAYSFMTKGAAGAGVAAAEISGYTAPITNVIACAGNISAPSAILRINGTQVAIGTQAQGSGNYGNYPLYIGRRGGVSSPFNGHLYSLIIRGAQSTAQQIASAEAWVNQRTGAY